MDGAPDAIAWLYCQGKEAFDRKDYGAALDSFEFCLEKLAAEHARCSDVPFDPTNTGYRHLDDYLSLTRTRQMVLNRRSPERAAVGAAPTGTAAHDASPLVVCR